jgi:hypothetical protein|tara:strand:+ start:25036 stop:25281 length:246 start_codon:yes stop_codon:yes gene_type:complete
MLVVFDLMKLMHDAGLPASGVVGVQSAFLCSFVQRNGCGSNGFLRRLDISGFDLLSGRSDLCLRLGLKRQVVGTFALCTSG